MYDERLFDAHMFAKQSFGVKYLLRISSAGGHIQGLLASEKFDVTPREQNHNMTAALTYTTDFAHTDLGRTDFGHADFGHAADRGKSAAVRLSPEIYRARRVAALAVGFAMLVVAVVGLTSIASQAAATRGAEADITESVSITVMAGDTLWGIARQLAPNHDPRPLVAELSAIAGDGAIQPGQELLIPAGLLG